MNLPEGMVVLDRESLHPRIQERELDVVVCLADQLPDSWAAQIIDKVRQPHVMAYEGHEDVGTPEVPGRYYDLAQHRLWSEKGRLYYLLVDNNRHPAGDDVPDIGIDTWYGKREHSRAPGCDLTYAVRGFKGDEEKGYGNYQGVRLGSPFMKAHQADLPIRFPDSTGVWLDLVEGNDDAENLYRNNGYVELDRFADPDHGGQRRILMANYAIFGAERPNAQ